MKKNLLVILCCFFLFGCESVNNENLNQEPANYDQSDVLMEPKLEWCQLYNPNGFNTVTCVVSNPNEDDIDITYDLVYYKDKKEVARSEQFANFNISSEHNALIWANNDIPKNTDVDMVVMENIEVVKSYNQSIDATYNYVGITDNKAYFDFEFTKKPTLASVWFVLYNDNNKNNKLDQGEIVVTSIASTTNQKDKLYFETDVFKYTNYEVFYEAY